MTQCLNNFASSLSLPKIKQYKPDSFIYFVIFQLPFTPPPKRRGSNQRSLAGVLSSSATCRRIAVFVSVYFRAVVVCDSQTSWLDGNTQENGGLKKARGATWQQLSKLLTTFANKQFADNAMCRIPNIGNKCIKIRSCVLDCPIHMQGPAHDGSSLGMMAKMSDDQNIRERKTYRAGLKTNP